jgi:hypothetical protein
MLAIGMQGRDWADIRSTVRWVAVGVSWLVCGFPGVPQSAFARSGSCFAEGRLH